MASAPKKRALPSELQKGSDSSSEEGSEDSDSSSVDSQLEIQVDFEARDIQESDFHGIRRLLQQVFLKTSVDLSGITDLIIGQRRIGSTIKVCESEEDSEPDDDDAAVANGEEEVYGITTVLNLTHHRDQNCVKQLNDLLLTQCKAHGGSELPQLDQILRNTNKHVGLLVNERFLNIPPAIAPPLLRSLVMETQTACSMGQPYDFHYYVIIARSHLVTVARQQAGKKRTRKGKSLCDDSEPSREQPVFDYFENEILQKAAVLSFSYPLAEDSDSVLGGRWSFDDEAMKPYRTVMIIPARKLEQAIAEVEEIL